MGVYERMMQERQQEEAARQAAQAEAAQSKWGLIQISTRRWQVIERDGFAGTSDPQGNMLWYQRWKPDGQPVDHETARQRLIELRRAEGQR